LLHRKFSILLISVLVPQAARAGDHGPRATFLPASRGGTEAIRALLFADQLPGELLKGSNYGNGAIEEARKLVVADRPGDAQKALERAGAEDKKNPSRPLLAAYVAERLGKIDEAKRLLREAIKPNEHEARERLWACRALRALGEEPDRAIASELLGVVIEVPFERGLDSLAAYPDGTARYINQSGAMTLYDPWNDPLRKNFAPFVSDVIKEARPLVAKIPLNPRVTSTSYVITLLTCAGSRSITFDEVGESARPLMDAAARLLVAMAALTPDLPDVVARCHKKKDAAACVELAERREKSGDPRGAIDLRKRACDHGDVAECMAAALALIPGPHVTDRAALAEGFALFEIACKRGAPGGCNNLALMLDTGMGVPVDTARAAVLMKKSCDLGDLRGCANLGSRYAFGTGVPKDRTRAREYLDKACRGGLPEGCVDLPKE
jgi:hypothetical protein